MMNHDEPSISWGLSKNPDRMSCSSFIDPIARKSKSCGNGRTKSQRCQCRKVIHAVFHGGSGTGVFYGPYVSNILGYPNF
jgi:hypothetical protein